MSKELDEGDGAELETSESIRPAENHRILTRKYLALWLLVLNEEDLAKDVGKNGLSQEERRVVFDRAWDKLGVETIWLEGNAKDNGPDNRSRGVVYREEAGRRYKDNRGVDILNDKDENFQEFVGNVRLWISEVKAERSKS